MILGAAILAMLPAAPALAFIGPPVVFHQLDRWDNCWSCPSRQNLEAWMRHRNTSFGAAWPIGLNPCFDASCPNLVSKPAVPAVPSESP